ncbi:MAG TPA: sulfate ABC transporter permease subunit CysT [Mycobacteriales bacterium]|nr:sulfate ABC transporter permease subunit CysT [Mycobacteriales bacterium]
MAEAALPGNSFSAKAHPRRRSLLRPVAAGVGPGLSMLYLSLLVGLPVAAVISQSAHHTFWSSITQAHTRSVLEFTVLVALAAAAVDAVTGVALAWVLVRDDFPGKRVVNALIDLPFALPTIVAGLVLLSLYGPDSPVGVNVEGTRIAVLFALLFVTLPFVTRAVQPVLLTLERDVEDAAACLGAKPWTVFRRIILPAILPATLTGASLAFARALGEFGSVVLISGNLPRSEIASQVIFQDVENGVPQQAAAIGVVLLAMALVIFVVTGLVTRRNAARHG